MELNAVNISKTSQLKTALTSAKLTESSIQVERVISWLDNKKVCFLNKTKINLNGEWVYVGDSEIQEFYNTEESLKLLKSSVPEPFLTAVLAIWGTKKETGKLEKLEEKIEGEVLENE